MSTEILETSPLYQEWIREATEKGMAQTWREAVRVALRGRFGELAPDLEEAVSRASESVLEDTLAHITTDTLDQIRSRFGL